MIQRLIWPERYRSDKDPFTDGQPLKITFHSSSFANLSSNEDEALNLIRSFSELKEIESYGFSETDSRRISFRKNPGEKEFGVKVTRSDGGWSLHAGFPLTQVNRKFLDKSTTQILEVEDYDDPRVLQSPTNDLMYLEAHLAIRNHIFVTTSEYIHKFKDNYYDANVRLPTEALKIIGIFLRSKGFWLYGGNLSSDPRLFYSYTIQSQIPNLKRWTNSLSKWAGADKEKLRDHSQSFMKKCRRALRTKDILGSLFYRMQTYEILDEQLYYFDYLTILLAGAFDSLAEMSSILFKPIFYGNASFRNKSRKRNFVESLREVQAKQLADVVTNDNAIMLQTMLFDLRNTIHGVLPSGRTNKDFDRNDESFIEVDAEYRDKIWDTAAKLNNDQWWGLKHEKYSIFRDDRTIENTYRIKLEPFNYGNQLISKWFSFFNEILATFTLAENDPVLSPLELKVRKIVDLIG